jgi:glucokinase
MSAPRLVVGVDLGGTSIVVGTVPGDGSAVYGFATEPTPVQAGPDAVVDRMVEMIRGSIDATRRELGAGIEVAGVGVGAPGPLDTARGIVIVAPNLGWKDMPLRDRIAQATGLEITLENDANCATLGEWWRGAAQGGRFVAGITIGTGIGGGIVLDGKIYHGASDVAAEFGHTTIDLTGRRCKCGNYGCLEAYASGPAIAGPSRRSRPGRRRPSRATRRATSPASPPRPSIRRPTTATRWRSRWCATPPATWAPASPTWSTS